MENGLCSALGLEGRNTYEKDEQDTDEELAHEELQREEIWKDTGRGLR
jgi:hypothetical protein